MRIVRPRPQEEGHLNLTVSPPPPPPDRVPFGRLIPWVILAVLLICGLVLYFRYGTRVTPLLDATR